jgi:flavin-binding protein dodecin
METDMAIAKVIEIIASSNKGIEDAVASGIAKASETVQGIEGAWVKDTKVTVRDGKVSEWRVILSVTFIVQ